MYSKRILRSTLVPDHGAMAAVISTPEAGGEELDSEGSEGDSASPGPSAMSTSLQNLATMPDVQEPQHTEKRGVGGNTLLSQNPNWEGPSTSCTFLVPKPGPQIPVTPKMFRSSTSARHHQLEIRGTILR